jgi:UDP-3-O-[3-hydroxymyristoyl] glucosamine N-acyltransferase
MTHTYSGGRDQTAVIGHAPEDRNWKPGDRAHKPFICSGARIEAFVTVDAGTKRATHIGRRTWLMKRCHVGHDAYIGEDCEIAPGTVICGWAEIGNGVKIGVNASILPHRKVGDGARIGAGAVVTKDVPAGETWVGNPARPLCATVTIARRIPLPHPDAVPRLQQSVFNSEKSQRIT